MNTRRIVYIAIFTALITVGGLISVPIPFTQVQLSFQTFFVITAGLLLGARDGALAALVYLVMGLVGLPVFTQGGGPAYVFMPSFGYLIGFPVGAFVAGAVCARGKKPTKSRAFAAALIGMVPAYLIGMTYQVLILYYYTGITWAAAIGGLPALGVLAVKDAVLLGVAAALYPTLHKVLGNRKTQARRSNVGNVEASVDCNRR